VRRSVCTCCATRSRAGRTRRRPITIARSPAAAGEPRRRSGSTCASRASSRVTVLGGSARDAGPRADPEPDEREGGFSAGRGSIHAPGGPVVARVLLLQRTAGNAAVQRLIRGGTAARTRRRVLARGASLDRVAGVDDSPREVLRFFRTAYDADEHLRRAQAALEQFRGGTRERAELTAQFRGRYRGQFRRLREAGGGRGPLGGSLETMATLEQRAAMPLAASFVIGFRESGSSLTRDRAIGRSRTPSGNPGWTTSMPSSQRCDGRASSPRTCGSRKVPTTATATPRLRARSRARASRRKTSSSRTARTSRTPPGASGTSPRHTGSASGTLPRRQTCSEPSGSP
jgi:hypothetical protein